MRCLSPKIIRAPRAGDKARKHVSCGQCHPCRTNMRLQAADRVEWEFSKHPSPVMFTPTYAPENLPLSPAQAADERNPQQIRLEANILRRSQQEGPSTSKHDRALLKILRAPREPLPTVHWPHIRAYRDAVRHQFDGELFFFPVAEYGTKYGRPHYHVLVSHPTRSLTISEIEWIHKRWPHGQNQVLLITGSRALRYVAKDIQKGTPYRETFVAEGRVPPKVYWPRKPIIAANQADMIFKLLHKQFKDTCPTRLELEIRLLGLGKWFTVSRKGKMSRRRFGVTAFNHAMERLRAAGMLTERGAENAMIIQDYTAMDALGEITPGSFNYSEVKHDAYEAQQARAADASTIAKIRHRRILTRKGL